MKNLVRLSLVLSSLNNVLCAGSRPYTIAVENSEHLLYILHSRRTLFLRRKTKQPERWIVIMQWEIINIKLNRTACSLHTFSLQAYSPLVRLVTYKPTAQRTLNRHNKEINISIDWFSPLKQCFKTRVARLGPTIFVVSYPTPTDFAWALRVGLPIQIAGLHLSFETSLVLREKPEGWSVEQPEAEDDG